MTKTLRALSLVSVLVLMLPVAAAAQTSQDDLRAAIQVSVLADPRVSNIPPEQLKELIDALVLQASAQNMTAADILWQPQNAAAANAVSDSSVSECESGWQGYLCQVDHIFGFSGNNYEIPLIILVTSGLLAAVIWELIHYHHKKLAEKGMSSPALDMVVKK